MIEQKLREYKSDLEEMLKKHKENLSNRLSAENEIERLENKLKLLEPSYIQGTAYSDMPKSKTNKFHSTVENNVIDMEYQQTEISALKSNLEWWRDELKEYQYRTRKVEALLEGLTEEEKFVVEQFYINDVTWRIVAERYRKEFGVYISRTPLKNKRDNAFEKMERNAGIADNKKFQNRPELVRY
jgi:chromosome segregation ATPase